MNIANKDLNLLLVFQMLYQERNASLAAERMALSQPALSHKLNKLRHQFGDPLFVRAPRGLTPTPRAHELAPQVQHLVEQLELFYERCDGADMLTRPARLHLYSTDYLEQTLLPRLLPILRSQAPTGAGHPQHPWPVAARSPGERHVRLGHRRILHRPAGHLPPAASSRRRVGGAGRKEQPTPDRRPGHGGVSGLRACADHPHR